jgi:hypothetical protein
VNVIANFHGSYGATGFNSYFHLTGAGTINHINNYQSHIFQEGSGTKAELRGYWAYMQADLGTTTNAYGFYNAGIGINSGAVTNGYGFFTEDLGGLTKAIGYYSGITAGSNKWGFFSGGDAYNYFAGNVGINTQTPQYGRLQVNGSGAYNSGYCLYAGSGNIAGMYLISDGAGDFNWMLTRGGSNTAGIVIKANGDVVIGSLAGTGNRPVYADSNGRLYC